MKQGCMYGSPNTCALFLDINKKFSSRYYLTLVLIDEENRRYFKQQEITLYRRKSMYLEKSYESETYTKHS